MINNGEKKVDNIILKKEIDKYSVYKNLYKCITLLTAEKGKKSIKKYLYDNKVRKVIIYGAGCIGKIAFDCLKEVDECEIMGVVDKSKNTEFGLDNFIELDELTTMDFDLCIITPLKAYDSISKELKERNIKKYCNILELVDYERRKKYENGVSF